jgi:hypothetical protein
VCYAGDQLTFICALRWPLRVCVDVSLGLIQHDEKVQYVRPSYYRQQLAIASWLQDNVYGRTRRITFTQLTQRQWLQSPLPYNRANRLILKPAWLATRRSQIRAGLAAANALAFDDMDGEASDAE